jgi:hypothetical protein
VVEASQYWSLGDRSIANQVARYWALEPKAAMGTVEVVVLRELDEDGAQMTLVDDNHVIQALAANRANQPLRDGILPSAPGMEF